jgi:N-carbamoylputrescine amidase
MSTQPVLTTALVQMSCCADRAANEQHIREQLRAAAAQGAQLVLLQELHNTLYFCQTEDNACFDLAEPVPGPSTEKLSALARELELVIVASLFERRAAGLYHNTAVVLDRDGSLAGTYQWFPEAARLMALAGAELLLYPTAIGWDPDDPEEQQQRQLNAWQTVQRAHAIANGIPLLVCNRTGFERDSSGQTAGIQFWGSSFVAGPQGEVLASAPPDSTELLRDRRVDAYDELSLRFRDST